MKYIDDEKFVCFTQGRIHDFWKRGSYVQRCGVRFSDLISFFHFSKYQGWIWNSFVSLRPIYFVFTWYLKTEGGGSNEAPKPPLRSVTALLQLCSAVICLWCGCRWHLSLPHGAVGILQYVIIICPGHTHFLFCLFRFYQKTFLYMYMISLGEIGVFHVSTYQNKIPTNMMNIQNYEVLKNLKFNFPLHVNSPKDCFQWRNCFLSS